MAKLALINRQKKREKLVKKFAANVSNCKDHRRPKHPRRRSLPSPPEDAGTARNANPTRLRNRLRADGPSAWRVQQSSVWGATNCREIAMRGECRPRENQLVTDAQETTMSMVIPSPTC